MPYGIQMRNLYGNVIVDEELGHLIFSEYIRKSGVLDWFDPDISDGGWAGGKSFILPLARTYSIAPLVSCRCSEGGVIPHVYPIRNAQGKFDHVRVFSGDINFNYTDIEFMIMGSSLDQIVTKTIPAGETHGIQTILEDGRVLFDSRWTELVTSAQVIPFPDLGVSVPSDNMFAAPVVNSETRKLNSPYTGYFFCLAGVYGNKQRESPLKMMSVGAGLPMAEGAVSGGNYVPTVFQSATDEVTLTSARTGIGPHDEDFLFGKTPGYDTGAPLFNSTPYGGHLVVLRYEPLDNPTFLSKGAI